MRAFDELVAANLLEADLATALYLAPDPSELTFLTLDQRQGRCGAGLRDLTGADRIDAGLGEQHD